MYDLYIANKNYSSWSLRPWVLMRELGIAFREHLLAFGQEASWQSYRKISLSGKVPCLVDGDTVVWDSLAIAEYLADGLHRFGGPYLAGAAFTAADAFYAPVAFRIQTYGLDLDAASAAYVDRVLGTRAMREWYAEALQETLRDLPHEEEVLQFGTVLEDLRAK